MNELKKILLVEDNPYIMNINARLLSMNGYEALKYDRMSRKFIERYPDLLKYPVYTPSGKRIMLSIEDACSYADLKPGIYKDCCSCRHYQQKKGTLLGVCSHEKMRSGSIKQMNTSASKEETV